MADGILGLGSAGSAGLNQDLIDKLKEADRKATVEPFENRLEDWTKEQEKFQEILDKSNELLDAIKPFDLFASGGITAFDQKTANVTGNSAIFDAVDVSNIDEGTTTVKISQLAQKDVYQSNSFTDKSEQISGGNDAGDMIVLSQAGKPVYESDLKIDSSAALVDPNGGDITININGNDRVFTVDATTTYKDLMNKINDDTDLKATITISGRLSISAEDETSELTITENISSPMGISRGEKFSTEGMTYEQLANQINANSKYNATIETVGSGASRLVIKSAETGLDNALEITQKGVDFGLNTYTSTNSIVETDPLADGLSLTIDGQTFTTAGDTYDSFIAKIEADPNFTAFLNDDNKLEIKREDGTSVSYNPDKDDLNLGLNNNNHTLKAQNLLANIDGIDYDTSSNVLVVNGGLKITAVEINEPGTSSTISIQNDTSAIAPLFEEFVAKYNEFMDLVNNELYSSESSIEDKSTLRTVIEGIKENLFGNYGQDDNLNIFNFGIEIDKTGYLSMNTSKFNEAIENDMESLQSLIIGSAEKEGAGTSLKNYIDSLDSLNGLLYGYETNMNTRKTNLEKDKDEAQESLDERYSQMAAQFASYTAIITQFENQFSGLKMMIEQSVSG